MDEETQRLLDEAAQYRAASAVPYSDYQVPASNVGPSSFASNLGGLLFGGADSGLNEYLSRDQQKQMQSQALMSAAMSLLKNSGYTTQPISLGQALGTAYEAGQTGYQTAQENAIKQLLTKQKLDEAKREQALQQLFLSRIPGLGTAAIPSEQVTPSLPVSGQPLTPTQVFAVSPDTSGPTQRRAAMIGQVLPTDAQTLPEVTVTRKTKPDIFSTLSPDQAIIAAMNPKAALPKLLEESLKTESFSTLSPSEAESFGLDPRGKYQINNRTNQISTLQAPGEEYKIVSGPEAIKYGLPGVGSYQLNTKTNQATLLGTAEGPFGGGTTGNAYNILLTEDPSSAKYALAYRELNKPVPTEQIQPDGSIKIVYTQPAPIPPSFPKPTYKGKIPTEPVNPATVVQPSVAKTTGVKTPSVTTAPIVGETGIQVGVKSTPYAPTPAQIGEARKQILVIDKLVTAVNALETDVKTNAMQIGGFGEAGGRQEALFQDAILQLKELQNLGVLNGPDERILLQQLADPTSLKSFLKGKGGPDYVFSKITELRNKAMRERELINQQFPQPISMPRQVPEPPAAIKDILKIYPPRKP